MNPLRTGWSVVAAVTLLLAAACGGGSAQDSPSSDHPERSASFEAPEITWAQGTTVHYGDRTIAVPGQVRQLWRTSYGFLLWLRRLHDPNAASELVFVDGSSTTPIEGEPSDIKLSPDGRYAGWIDFHGPKRAIGRLAQAVVVDLRTGETVLRNHDDMGGPTDDLGDLYEDAEVDFLGFDEKYAYWDTPTGEHQRRRAVIGTWKIESAGRPTGDGSEEPIGHPYDSLSGLQDEATAEGHLVPTKDGLTGFRSPSTRWCLTDGQPGRLPVTDCRTHADATPAYPARSVLFGGWQGPDTYYVLARKHYRFNGDPGARDRSTGVITSCTLPSGSCRTVVPVRHTESIVFGTGDTPEMG